jgi:hypothetical protein
MLVLSGNSVATLSGDEVMAITLLALPKKVCMWAQNITQGFS